MLSIAKYKEINSGKVSLIILSVFFLIITFFGGSLPFFWNMLRYSEIAHYYLENNFTSLIIPQQYDNGNPPFYGLYFAIVWAIFGKSLLISHLAFYPFIIGSFYQFYLICKKYLPEKHIAIALLLLSVEPTFLTQSLLMGYDIVLMFLFLLGFNQLQGKGNYWMLSLALLLMLMLSLRGIIMSGSLVLIMMYINKQENSRIISLKQCASFLPAILFIFIWYGIRFYNSGYFITAYNNPEHREWVGFERMIRNTFYIGWKIVDFGRIGLVIFIFFRILSIKKTKALLDPKVKQLVMSLLIILLCFSAVMIPLSNPIAHPYFMILTAFMILLTMMLLRDVIRKWRALIVTALVVLMISGNIWLYPLRFGNGWDASLKILPYFTLYEKMKIYIEEENIDEEEIGTAFPVSANMKYSHLTNEAFSYVDKDYSSIDNYRYILHSNVINTFTPEELKSLESEWALMKTFHSGQVYLSLYKKPP